MLSFKDNNNSQKLDESRTWFPNTPTFGGNEDWRTWILEFSTENFLPGSIVTLMTAYQDLSCLYLTVHTQSEDILEFSFQPCKKRVWLIHYAIMMSSFFPTDLVIFAEIMTVCGTENPKSYLSQKVWKFF